MIPTVLLCSSSGIKRSKRSRGHSALAWLAIRSGKWCPRARIIITTYSDLNDPHGTVMQLERDKTLEAFARPFCFGLVGHQVRQVVPEGQDHHNHVFRSQ